MAFFPSYESKFTKTPNIFFDSIMAEATLNEIRIIAYLIRNTLGYNSESTWTGVSREDLIKNAYVSNGQLSQALFKAEEKGWILSFIEGEKGKQKRYIFLNDEINEQIVHGLKEQYFTVSDLEHLNHAGIKALIDRHNIAPLKSEKSTLSGNRRGTETVGGSTPTETVEGALRKSETYLSENRRGSSTETVEVKVQQAQAQQGLADSLKTNIKDNTNKDISKDNNKKIVVAANVDSISEIESHKTLLKTVVSDRVSDATINTWLRYGEPDQILKAWYKANEVSGVEDIGAYVTWMLKDGITSIDQKKTKQTEPEQSHPFYEMLRAAEEAAVTKEVSETEVITPLITEISSQEVWANVLSDLQLQLSAPAFETWVKPLIVLDCTQNQIVIKAKDEFHKDWLEQRYSVMIRSAVKTAMNTDAVVKFVV